MKTIKQLTVWSLVVVMLLTVISFPTPIYARNITPTTERVSFGNRQFQLFDYQLSWNEAQAFSMNLGGNLAVVSDQATQNFLNDLMQQGSRVAYWVGAYRIADHGDNQFVWVDGTPMTFTNWYPGEPNNMGGNENRIDISRATGRWNDIPKYRTMGFIVEWRIPYGGSNHSPIYTFNNSSYQVVNLGMNWYDAKAYAEAVGGRLASITSQAEQDFIQSLLSRYGTQNSYWLGGYWIGNTSNPATDFHWLSGEPATFSAWAPGQPDAGGASNQAIAFVRQGHPGWDWENMWDDLVRFPNTDNPNYTFNIQNLGFIVEWNFDYLEIPIQYSILIGVGAGATAAALWVQKNWWWISEICTIIESFEIFFSRVLSDPVFNTSALSGYRWVGNRLGGASVYSIPFSGSSNHFSTLRYGERVTVHERIQTSGGEWASFTGANGQRGFVRTRYLRTTSSQQQLNGYRWTTSVTHLHSGTPGGNLSFQRSIPTNTQLWASYAVRDRYNRRWVRVRWGNSWGYVIDYRLSNISSQQRLNGYRWTTSVTHLHSGSPGGNLTFQRAIPAGSRLWAYYAVRDRYNRRWVRVGWDGSWGYVIDYRLRN